LGVKVKLYIQVFFNPDLLEAAERAATLSVLLKVVPGWHDDQSKVQQAGFHFIVFFME
jgi:hypothetical protein